MKCASPSRQSRCRSLVRNAPAIRRARLCIQPVCEQLAHRGVDDGVAGAALAPGVEQLGVVVPLRLALVRVRRVLPGWWSRTWA